MRGVSISSPTVQKIFIKKDLASVFDRTLSGIGRIYAHCVVDTYGSFAFLHTNKIPAAVVSVVHNDVLPQYKYWKIEVEAILTDNGRTGAKEIWGRDPLIPYSHLSRITDYARHYTWL